MLCLYRTIFSAKHSRCRAVKKSPDPLNFAYLARIYRDFPIVGDVARELWVTTTFIIVILSQGKKLSFIQQSCNKINIILPYSDREKDQKEEKRARKTIKTRAILNVVIFPSVPGQFWTRMFGAEHWRIKTAPSLLDWLLLTQTFYDCDLFLQKAAYSCK